MFRWKRRSASVSQAGEYRTWHGVRRYARAVSDKRGGRNRVRPRLSSRFRWKMHRRNMIKGAAAPREKAVVSRAEAIA